MEKNKAKCFQYLVDKTWNRITSWKAKFLSNAVKEILIKVAIQAIHSYVMSIFLLPKKTTAKIDSMIRNFWWGFNGDYTIEGDLESLSTKGNSVLETFITLT